MGLESTQEKLSEWGRWVWTGPTIAPRYMSPATAMYLRNVEQNGKHTPNITDDEALLIDAAVARLRLRDTQMGSAVYFYHAHNCGLRELARELHCDKRKATELLRAGEAWIDAVLFESACSGAPETV